MRRGLVSSFLIAAAALPLFAGLTFGLSWFSHNSSLKSTVVNIANKSMLGNGKVLQPGNYRLEIPLNTQTPKLKFFQGGKLVATAPAHVKNEAQKAATTEIAYQHKKGSDYMTEVRPAGMNESFVLTKSGKMKSGS